MPASVRQAPRGMKRSRFWTSSATAESPELRSKDQPGGRSVPDAYSVATRIQAVEAATPAHGRRRFMGREDSVFACLRPAVVKDLRSCNSAATVSTDVPERARRKLFCRNATAPAAPRTGRACCLIRQCEDRHYNDGRRL